MSARTPAAMAVVIPTRNRPAQLDRCLAAVVPQARAAGGVEVVVVDSASDDAGAVAAVAAAHGAQLVRCDLPGASRARNAGWRSTDADLVAFLDDDMTALPGWVGALRSAADGADLVTGSVAPPPGDEDVVRPVAVKLTAAAHPLEQGTLGAWGCSGNMAVRRTWLERVGGFDERIGPGCWFSAAEDLDLLARLVVAGARGGYDPRPRTEHEQWRTRRDLLGLEWSYGKGMGLHIARMLVRDRRWGTSVAVEAIWDDGLAVVGHQLRVRYKTRALLAAVRTSATLVGLVAALLRPALLRDPTRQPAR